MGLEVIYTQMEGKEVALEYKGVEIKFKIRPLTWSKKNQILSQCFTYKSDGSATFNFDKYIKDTLCETIYDAPWGETNHMFLTKISPEFGSMLEKLVPNAFPEGQQQSNFFAKG
jgi:hypothetical protein